MARKVRTEEEDAQIDMTPMLDIVFIMLIFFIVTTVFVKATFLKQNCESFIRPLPEYFPIGEDSNKKFGWELCPK